MANFFKEFTAKQALTIVGLVLCAAIAVLSLGYDDAPPDPYALTPEETLFEGDVAEYGAPKKQMKGRETGLPIPRFITTKSNKVNLRNGPAKDQKITLTYRKKGVPLEVTDEFENWLRVRDKDGAAGWVHRVTVTGRRYVFIYGGRAAVREAPSSRAPILTRAEEGALLRVTECKRDWCRIKHDKLTGWIQKIRLYGVYPYESGRLL